MNASELEACYQSLGLQADASLKELDDAYFQIKGQLICAGKRQDIAPIKAAHDKIKRHLLAMAAQPMTPAIATDQHDHQHAEPSLLPTSSLTELLAHQGITARASIREQTLHLGITINAHSSQKQISSQIYDLLGEINPENYALGQVAIVRLYGLEQGKKTLWKESFPLPNLQPTADDTDLYSFNNRFSNTLIFPGLLLIAALLNISPTLQLLLFSINIWIHECGHATVAWLSGYRAIPLPFGWTSIETKQSLFVYFGVLTLLALLFWTGQKEQRRWPMVLACILAIVQFYMTWIMPENTFYMLFPLGVWAASFISIRF